jgi:hypothetical protein
MIEGIRLAADKKPAGPVLFGNIIFRAQRGIGKQSESNKRSEAKDLI